MYFGPYISTEACTIDMGYVAAEDVIDKGEINPFA